MALTEKSSRCRGDRADLDTIRYSTSLPSRKPLRKFLRKKRICAAIEEKLSADCSRLFPPCYSFGSYGYEIEEKNIEEEVFTGKIKDGKTGKEVQSRKGSSRGGDRPPAPHGKTRLT